MLLVCSSVFGAYGAVLAAGRLDMNNNGKQMERETLSTVVKGSGAAGSPTDIATVLHVNPGNSSQYAIFPSRLIKYLNNGNNAATGYTQ